MTPHEFLTLKGIKSNTDDINVPNVVNWLNEYADEAIKADRINLLNHIKLRIRDIDDSYYISKEYSYGDNDIQIDNDSVINAPNIALK